MPRVTANTATFSASLGAVARVSKAAGFDGLELWQADIGPAALDAASVRALLSEKELAISAVQVLRDFEGCPAADQRRKLEEAEVLLELTDRVGADTLLVCANTQPSSSGSAADQVDDLRRLGEMAAARRVRIAFEPLAWSRWLNRYEAVLPFIDAVNHASVGVALDCFHLFHQGSPVELVDALPADRCFLVQLCDGVPMDMPALQIARHHRLFPGEGSWPVAELVRRVERKGYDGFYNIEVMNDRYKTADPAWVARRAYASFVSMFDPLPSVGGTTSYGR